MVAGMTEAGQRCDEPLHEKEEGRPYQGHFGRARPRGDHPLQMGRLLLMDRTSPEAAGRFSGACGSVLGSFGTCGSLEKP
jgi:hypothetical protein